MTYIDPHMPEALARHELTVVLDTEKVKVFRMARPNESAYRVQITFTPEGIALQGDIGFGAAQNGICSRGGYGVGWFGRQQSEGYLCSKFLSKCWQRGAVERDLRSWLTQAEETLADAIAEEEKELEEGETIDPADFTEEQGEVNAWKALLDFWGDETSDKELYEEGSGYFQDFWDYSIGHDYPLSDAGWLCAVQQRFAELFAALEK